MSKKKTHQLNDRTIKYSSIAQSKRQHQYFGLPGEFKTRLSQEIVFPNMESGRQDECYVNNKGLIICLEEESGEVTPKTLDKFAKYSIFRNYWHFPNGTYFCVICHKKPKADFEIYEHSPSCYIKVFYIHISQDELLKKYEKVISKVQQKEELTDMEALDIAFVCKFISKKYALEVIETLSYAFKKAIIRNNRLKMDVGVILGAMIQKRIENTNTQNRLFRVIDMKTFENEIQRLVYDEFGDELEEKDREIETQKEKLKTKDKEIKTKNKEIETLTKSNKAYKKKIEELKEIGDTNSPKAQEIIKSLMLI